MRMHFRLDAGAIDFFRGAGSFPERPAPLAAYTVDDGAQAGRDASQGDGVTPEEQSKYLKSLS
jgi:hypothetical protein